MQPAHAHLLVSCPASAVWWLRALFTSRTWPFWSLQSSSCHSLCYTQLLQRLKRFQDHTHHPGAVPAHTHCTTIVACPACMLCRYAQALHRSLMQSASRTWRIDGDVNSGAPEFRKVSCRHFLRAGTVCCADRTLIVCMATVSSRRRGLRT